MACRRLRRAVGSGTRPGVTALHRIADAAGAEAPKAAQGILARVRSMDAAMLDKQADPILDGRFQGVELGAASFVAAALQVYWAYMSTTLGVDAFGRTEPANLCPVCASAPAASIVRIGGTEQGLRYLHCSLCASEWHMVRSKCSNCESSRGVAYYGIEGDKGAIKAEACAECGSYLNSSWKRTRSSTPRRTTSPPSPLIC